MNSLLGGLASGSVLVKGSDMGSLHTVCFSTRMRIGKMFGNRGFTLIEVLVAFILMAIGMIIIWGMHMSSFRVDVQNRRQSTALSYAGQVIERLKSRPFADIEAVAPQPFSEDSRYTYSVARSDGNASTLFPEGITTRKDIKVTFWWDERIRNVDGNRQFKRRKIELFTTVARLSSLD
jgi:prepilin-type N-terminal cleavage/methylation domain-containing protein